MTPQQMQDNLLVLENDGIFYSKFMECYKTEQVNAFTVREVIRVAINRLKLNVAIPEEREEMRRYFEERYSLKPSYAVNARGATRLLGELAQPAQPKPPTPTPTISTPTLKEHPAMTTIITLTTKHYINGTEVSTLSNAQIFKLIADQEASIAELEAIKKKPQSLKKEIATRQASIDTLVAFLDERDAKDAKA